MNGHNAGQVELWQLHRHAAHGLGQGITNNSSKTLAFSSLDVFESSASGSRPASGSAFWMRERRSLVILFGMPLRRPGLGGLGCPAWNGIEYYLDLTLTCAPFQAACLAIHP